MKNFWAKVHRTSKNIVRDVKKDLTYFTPGLALAHAVGDLPLRAKIFSPLSKWASPKKNGEILAYLKCKYGDILEKVSEDHMPSVEAYDPTVAPIWVCWLQGEENAPPLVRRCIASIRQHAGKHPVHVLTEENLPSYIDLPSIIWKKRKEGKIQSANFSDVVRMALIYRYGGLWLDATIFCSKQIPDWYFSKDFFSCKGPVRDSSYISQYRWTSFALGGTKGSCFYKLMSSLFFAYWSEEEVSIDYLLVDYLIYLSYCERSDIRQMMDSLPENNLLRDEPAAYMGTPFSQERLKKWMSSDTVLFKLSWREPWKEKTPDGDKTFFGVFIREEI